MAYSLWLTALAFRSSALAFRLFLRFAGHGDEADGEYFAADEFAIALLFQNDEFLGQPA